MVYFANTNQYYTQGDIARREVLLDTLTIKDPVDTPLQLLLPNEALSGNIEWTWPVDTIDRGLTIADIAARTRTAGQDADFTRTPAGRARIGNVVQINGREIDVSGTQQVMDSAGIVNELAHQIEKDSYGMGCETEMFLLYGKYANNPGTQTQTGQKRQTHGLVSWIAELGCLRSTSSTLTTRALNNGALNARTVPSAYWPWFYYQDSDTQLTPAILFGSIFTPAHRLGMRINGSIGMMGSALKTAINQLSFGGISANSRDIPADMRAVYTNVDLVDTQWGKIWLMNNRYFDLPGESQTYAEARVTSTGPEVRGTVTVRLDKTMLFMEPGYAKIRTLRPRQIVPLAKVGDSSKVMMIQEMGLEVASPLAFTGGCNLIP